MIEAHADKNQIVDGKELKKWKSSPEQGRAGATILENICIAEMMSSGRQPAQANEGATQRMSGLNRGREAASSKRQQSLGDEGLAKRMRGKAIGARPGKPGRRTHLRMTGTGEKASLGREQMWEGRGPRKRMSSFD